MKNKLVILITAIAVVAACKTQQKVSYEFPDAMAAPVQAAFKVQCDKGKILYDINCAKCHNKTVKHKELIPDFTQEQLKGYEIRVTNAQHEMSLLESQVTPEELGLISTFLLYKKKNNLPVK